MMTEGQKYIKNNFIEELSYEQALENAIKEFQFMGIIDSNTLYASNGKYLDNPVYPANAELYDEFIDELGFDEEEFASYCVKRMEMKH